MNTHATSHQVAARRARLAGLTRAQAAIAETMTEDTGPESLLAEVRKLIRKLRLWAYHTHRSDRSDKGWPDLVIIGKAGLLYRELKTEEGKLRPEQLDIIDRLTAAGQNVDVWRPTDLLSGRIAAELSAIRCPPQ